jgi:uncharacterized protein (DUF58 family)
VTSLRPALDDLIELRHRAHAIGIASHHKVLSPLSGLYASVFRGQGMDYEETREYREGDEIRNMDWRVTARTGVPHLKVFREERERAVMLCVDAGPHMHFGTRGTFKCVQAARAAALLGWAAANVQDRVGAVLFGDPAAGPQYFRPSRARMAFWRMLRALASTSEHGSVGGDPLTEALERLNRIAPTGALVFVIADLNRGLQALQVPLGRLVQRHEVVVLPVDDLADREFPDLGRVVFRTHAGTRVEVDTTGERGRRQYRNQWQRHREALLTLGRRLGVPVIPLATHEDAERVLAEGLRRRHRRASRVAGP